MDKQVYPLHKITAAIRKQIEAATRQTPCWIKAGISEINFHGGGHCYVSLVEQKDGASIAQMRATIWGRTIGIIREEFGSDCDNVLKKGVEIVFLGLVHFHPVYGLQINVSKVDLSFNLGELERRKQATIKRLSEEGRLDKNSQVKLPNVVQRVALIASEQAAGYHDFFKQLENNDCSDMVFLKSSIPRYKERNRQKC